MSKDNILNLRVDAVSEPPRNKNQNFSISDENPHTEGNDNVTVTENSDIKSEDEIPVRPSRKKQSSKSKDNIHNQGAEGPKHTSDNFNGNGGGSINVINVKGSKNVHIGPLFVVNNGENKDKKSKDKKSKEKRDKKDDLNKDECCKETKSIKAVKSSTEKCTSKHIDIVKKHLGMSWKTIFRKLNYSDGEIEHFYIDHFNNGGLSEVIYQGLLDWTRNNPDEATLGNLCTVLWEESFCELVKQLACM